MLLENSKPGICGSSVAHKLMRLWVMFTSNSKMEGKCDLCDLNCGMDICTRKAGLSISETADLLLFSRTAVSSVKQNDVT